MMMLQKDLREKIHVIITFYSLYTLFTLIYSFVIPFSFLFDFLVCWFQKRLGKIKNLSDNLTQHGNCEFLVVSNI